MSLLPKVAEPRERTCTLCGGRIQIVEDQHGNRVPLNVEPVGETYIMANQLTFRSQKDAVPSAMLVKHYSSHVVTCERRKKAG